MIFSKDGLFPYDRKVCSNGCKIGCNKDSDYLIKLYDDNTLFQNFKQIFSFVSKYSTVGNPVIHSRKQNR